MQNPSPNLFVYMREKTITYQNMNFPHIQDQHTKSFKLMKYVIKGVSELTQVKCR
jgi:hypothetical protein